MIIGTEQGVQLSTDPELSMVWYKFHIGEGEDLYGTVRYEIVPSAVIAHIYPTPGINKTRLYELKKANDFLMQDFLVKEWSFEDVYFTTKSDFLVRILFQGKCEQVGNTEVGPLYIANIEEVLCQA